MADDRSSQVAPCFGDVEAGYPQVSMIVGAFSYLCAADLISIVFKCHSTLECSVGNVHVGIDLPLLERIRGICPQKWMPMHHLVTGEGVEKEKGGKGKCGISPVSRDTPGFCWLTRCWVVDIMLTAV